MPPYERYLVAEQDWVRATQAQFAPIRISERLWIVPSWCAAPDPDAVNVALDPGLFAGSTSAIGSSIPLVSYAVTSGDSYVALPSTGMVSASSARGRHAAARG